MRTKAAAPMKLYIEVQNGVTRFIVDCPFAKKHIPQEAGFRRDSDGYRWFTTDVMIAARLRAYAEGELRDRLNAILARAEQKPVLSLENGLYVFRSERSDWALARDANFFRDPNTGDWYTSDPVSAMNLAQYGDQRVHLQLRSDAAQIDARYEASRALDADIEIPAPPGRSYFPHQRAAVEYAKTVLRIGDQNLNGDWIPGMLLADAMRVGKTPSSVGVINLGGDLFKKILVVCPAGVKLGWYRELKAWLTTPRKIVIADSATSGWKFEVADISIVNFDVLKDLAEWQRKDSRDGRAVLKSLGRLDLPWDLVVIDEAHYIVNPTSLRSIVCYALLDRAKRKMALTGTPITNWIDGLYGLIHALDPVAWPTPNRFKARYGSGKDARNLPELERKLRSSIMCRRLLREVQPSLPPKLREVLEFSAEDTAAIRAIQREAAAWEKQRARLVALQAAAELAKASDDQKAHAEASRLLGEGKRVAFTETAKLRHETALVKVPYVVDHVRALIEDPAYKVVVGAWHTDVIEKLAESFGDRAVTVTGAVDASLKTVGGKETSDRMLRVDRFLEDPRCQVFFGNLVAAGMGLNLSSASHIVCAELWYVPWVMQQFEARCEHPTKSTSIFVQHAVLSGSIDARIARALVEKQTIIDKALDGVNKEEEVSIVGEPATKGLTRVAIERKAEGLTVRAIAAIHKGLKKLEGMNEVDAAIAKALSGYAVLAARQAVLGDVLVKRYGGSDER